MRDFLIPVYWAGLFACGAQGYNNTFGTWSTSIILSSAYGGGAIRDSVILHRHPAVLSLEEIPEVCIAWLGAFFQALYAKRRFFSILISLLDIWGVSTFIIIGIEVAQDYGCGPILTLASALTTALGGGVLSGLLSGLRLREILYSNIPYRCIVIAASILYVLLVYTGVSPLEAQCTIVLLTGVSNLIFLEWFQKLLSKFIQKQILIAASFKHTEILILPPYLWQKGEYIHRRASKGCVSYQQPVLRPLYHLMQPA